MMHNKESISRQFQALTTYAPALLLRAPGRINIIGEHTDYNQGLVLPGAIDRALYFAVRPNGTQQLRFWALDIEESAVVDLLEIKPGKSLWLNYLLGIAQQFSQRSHKLIGLDVVFGGNLPVGAGVSSSAALECGMAMSWNLLLKAGYSGPELAQLAKQSSHEFVGIPCGIMDQFASLNGVKDHAIMLDCRDLSFRKVPVAIEGCEWVLLNSKVSHNLAESAYVKRVEECAQGVAVLQQHFPEIKSLRDATPPQVEQLKEEFPGKVYQRCRYIVGEHYRTLAMIDALAAGDAKKVGQLLNLTQLGLAMDYEVSCPEIDFLFTQAFRHPGVYGARIMGGGFGGCTLNLVRKDARAAFVSEALAAYEAEFGKQGEELVVRLVDGVGEV
ncbi:galactokinase [Lewinella cohaerens]|uniref:galactokinase n=1 Tax=Lewinella cohaerens TaxID=70995 RepID=UPI000381DD35|nr:galactokinase [Lewinella cohaerens]